MKRRITYALIIVSLLVLAYFIPRVILFFLLCGIYDVTRNEKLDFSKLVQFFLGNGLFTWFVSPLNLLMDILAIPYLNYGVYQLEDLPERHRAEITRIIAETKKMNLAATIAQAYEISHRTMFFFRWYGKELSVPVELPSAFGEYRLIKTIGLSVFKPREATSRHFGPFRATLRVLYNLDETVDEEVYIEVGRTKHRWKDNPLFIFDDTLLHQSVNYSDNLRFCLFVDILRPSKLNFALSGVVSAIGFVLRSAKRVFYKNWKIVGG